MKAVILAAGEGSRLRPLTKTTPKPLIQIYDKMIIEHTLEALHKFVDEFIIVVQYKEDFFRKTLGYKYKKCKIGYHVQQDKPGTGAAIENLAIKGDFLIINGDSIFDKNDFERLIKMDSYGCLSQKVDNPEKYGIFVIDKEGNATKIVEKPKEFIGDLANLGVYKVNENIINYCKNIKESERGEYELIDAINEFMQKYNFKVKKIKGEFIDITYPWNILSANSHFLDNLSKSEIKGKVEKNVTINGKIVLEKGAILKSGTYIEGNAYIGENSVIGPNTYIRGNTVIGKNSKVGNACEVKNSSIGNNTKIPHLSYIGDSIIGNNVNVGAGFISANLRHDGEIIRVPIKGELIETGLKKFGVIIGDNSKLGVNNIAYPGRVLEEDSRTLPGTTIK